VVDVEIQERAFGADNQDVNDTLVFRMTNQVREEGCLRNAPQFNHTRT